MTRERLDHVQHMSKTCSYLLRRWLSTREKWQALLRHVVQCNVGCRHDSIIDKNHLPKIINPKLRVSIPSLPHCVGLNLEIKST